MRLGRGICSDRTFAAPKRGAWSNSAGPRRAGHRSTVVHLPDGAFMYQRERVAPSREAGRDPRGPTNDRMGIVSS
jgi:hypothetical protein